MSCRGSCCGWGISLQKLADGYQLMLTYHASAAEDWKINRIDNGAFTQLGATFTFRQSRWATQLGWRRLVRRITAYHKPSAGSWSSALASRTDTTFSGAGYIGMSGNDDNTKYLDDSAGERLLHRAARR